MTKKASKHPVATGAIGGALAVGTYLLYNRLPEDNWIKRKLRGGNIDKEIRNASEATKGFVDSTNDVLNSAQETGQKAVNHGKETARSVADAIKGGKN